MTEPVLDPAVFSEIRELMGDALGEFIRTYLSNSPLLINKIESGLAENDAELIFHSAHQLKGGSGSIGAMKVASISLDIEQIGRSGSSDGIAPLLNQLKSEFELVKSELTALL